MSRYRVLVEFIVSDCTEPEHAIAQARENITISYQNRHPTLHAIVEVKRISHDD